MSRLVTDSLHQPPRWTQLHAHEYDTVTWNREGTLTRNVNSGKPAAQKLRKACYPEIAMDTKRPFHSKCANELQLDTICGLHSIIA
ncbi:hypothetical protein PM082_001809 [Marasmius tenuissimus]|nr:hypothetical protein PM082_001809 [Marasmius tenuissimus]